MIRPWCEVGRQTCGNTARKVIYFILVSRAGMLQTENFPLSSFGCQLFTYKLVKLKETSRIRCIHRSTLVLPAWVGVHFDYDQV